MIICIYKSLFPNYHVEYSLNDSGGGRLDKATNATIYICMLYIYVCIYIIDNVRYWCNVMK